MSKSLAPPLRCPTVVHMLADAADRFAQRAALVCDGVSLTYADYAHSVAQLADELANAGIGKENRVALVMKNSLDAAIATLAVQAAGAQVVPLNPAYTSAELEPILVDAAVTAIIVQDDLQERISNIVNGDVLIISVGDDTRSLACSSNDNSKIALPLPDPESPSMLQYTGGTTGVAKGVNLSHRAVATNVLQREELFPTNHDDRILVITPLFHIYAISMGLYMAINSGGTMHIVKKFVPAEILHSIESKAITIMSASPTIFLGLMADPLFETTNYSSLRVCSSGSAALPEEVLNRWENVTDCAICEGYGQTEAGPVLTYNPIHGERRPGTVGLVVPGTNVEIVDLETGEMPLAIGEEGEIRARGPQLMSNYLNRPEETEATLRNGWLYTGDIGRFDKDGYLTICDRKKELVISAGFNVYPREIENVLMQHPAVEETAVVGVPDGYRGEVLHAYVVPRSSQFSEDEVMQHVCKRLTKYKWPYQIEFVEHLPRTSVGKIDKQSLRAWQEQENTPNR